MVWEFKKLSELCKTSAGGTPLKSNNEFYKDGTVPWLKSGEVGTKNISCAKNKITEYAIENSSAKIYPENSVLIAMYGATAGEVGILRFPSSSNQAVCAIYPSEYFLPEFLYYFFLSFKDRLIAQAVGNAQPNISQAKIKNTLIPKIELEEQKQIVAILDQAFAAIDQAQANIQQNIQNAQDLFQSKLNQIFSQQGEGWEERTLGEVCKKITDGAHHSPKILYPEQKEGLYPYITSKNIRNNYMDLSNVQYVDEDFHGVNYARCTPEVGDVLLTKDGANTGNITLNIIDEPFSLLSSVCLIKPKEELLPKYLKYYIQSPIGFKSITGKMTGTAIKRIILRDIKSAQIPLTTVTQQIELVKQMDSIHDATKNIENQYQIKLSGLEELKKSLLQKAFNGELTQTQRAA